ncbi:MAG: radical SAM protein [Thermodesulfovibrionales bacterium]|nr:radical SAM protein [Thermodesulfovibrionales bacterium]
MDKFKIDSHKLIYHVGRVNDWLEGKLIYPIYMEISPSGICNHRCTFCGLDFMEYQNRQLDAGILKERLSEMGSLGLKSVMYAGEGEPFLHRQMVEIIGHTKKSGIDAALTTNGVLMKESVSEKILGDVEWIKVSINAGTSETYAKIHRTKPADFDRVIKNMAAAARIKREAGHRCALGMQLILLPENKDEVVTLAKTARDIGMDYLVIKPYSQHLLSKTRKYEGVKYKDSLHLADELKKVGDDNFRVIFRARAMLKWDEGMRNYKRCLALPFWSYLDAGGNVWGCSVYLGDERFLYGNIYESTFREIWEGERRKKSIEWAEKKLNPARCRVNCRMDEINRYLWELKNPPEHVNFI